MRCDESSIGFRWRSKMSAYPELPLTDRHQSKSLRDLTKSFQFTMESRGFSSQHW